MDLMYSTKSWMKDVLGKMIALLISMQKIELVNWVMGYESCRIMLQVSFIWGIIEGGLLSISEADHCIIAVLPI